MLEDKGVRNRENLWPNNVFLIKITAIGRDSQTCDSKNLHAFR